MVAGGYGGPHFIKVTMEKKLFDEACQLYIAILEIKSQITAVNELYNAKAFTLSLSEYNHFHVSVDYEVSKTNFLRDAVWDACKKEIERLNAEKEKLQQQFDNL